MTKKEEKVWRAILDRPHDTAEEIADRNDVSPEFVTHLMSRIGTPDWREKLTAKPARCELLEEASKLTAGDRNKTYGEPVTNMQHIADIVNAWAGLGLTARNIAQVHIATKMARRITSPTHRDSYVDDMAYCGIEYECATSETTKS